MSAASSFMAALYERRANLMYDRIKSKQCDRGEGVVPLTPGCKSMYLNALEWYADSLGPLKFKYDRDGNRDGDDDDEDDDDCGQRG